MYKSYIKIILFRIEQIVNVMPRQRFPLHFEKKTYVYKMYLCVYPTELAHSKEITISFEPKPVTVAVIWKENLFQFYIIWIHMFFFQNADIFTSWKKDLMHKILNCIYICMDVCMFY
jgi:hypothetical protein